MITLHQINVELISVGALGVSAMMHGYLAFDQLAAKAGVELRLADLLPTIAVAGQPAGELTQGGAKLLDPAARLHPGIPCAHPRATPAPA